MRTHQQIDDRSLAMHRLVAAKVRREPALFHRAQRTLRRWRDPANAGRADPYLAEWDRLMARGLEETLAVVVEDSERAVALRQCSPFAGILSPAERFAFLKDWAATHAA